MAQHIHCVRKSLSGASWFPKLDRRSDLITYVADAPEASGSVWC
jgi:hypothetical protein